MAYKKEALINFAMISSVVLLLINVTSIAAQSGGAMGGSVSSSSSSSSSSSGRANSGYNYYIINNHYRTSGNASTISRSEAIGLCILVGFMIVIVFVFVSIKYFLEDKQKNSVLMLQIGLHGNASYLQTNLQSIASSANTSTLAGLNTILQETTRALLLRRDYWTHGSSYVDEKEGNANLKNRFQELSIRERTKVDFESDVNVNNVKYQVPVIQQLDLFEDLGQKFIVVTILLGLRGSHKLPVITGNDSMKEALEYLGSIRIREQEEVLVLWSPQNQMETMTGAQLKKKFFTLNPIGSS